MQQLCRARHGGREHDQLQQQRRPHGVDQLLVSGRGQQRRRHLPLLEPGVGDDAGHDPGSTFPIRINTGGPAFTDAAGQVWSADQAFSGGETYQTSVAIAGTVDDALYQTVRYWPSCSYSIPVPNGSYEVVLHFAEVWWTAANQRVFDVAMEGTVVIANLDVTAQVGAFTALVQTFPATVADGTLNVTSGGQHGPGDHRGHRGAPRRIGASAADGAGGDGGVDDQINLTWSDNAANETGFVIERCQGAGCSSFAGRHGGRQHRPATATPG